jgi:hypothetical protein
MNQVLGYQRPLPPSPPNLEANTITFGKYNGMTYEQVRSGDVGYCNWILKQTGTSGRMLHFQMWLRAKARKVTCECCNGSGLIDAI